MVGQDPQFPLVLRRLVKAYGGLRAVDEVSIELSAGSSLALIGPSGCGKSTLLRMVMGLIEPDSGEVVLSGVRLGRDNLRAARSAIGYVIQDGGLFPHLTTRDNIALKARDLGWSAARVAARLDELLQLTQLPAALMGRFPAQLSGGQRQRVGLMRALMLDPALMLMDEPLGALDPMVRSSLQAELRGIVKRLAKTVVFVTHDLAEAAYLGDEIALMRAGRIVQRGVWRDFLDRPADDFVCDFVNAQRGLHEPAEHPS